MVFFFYLFLEQRVVSEVQIHNGRASFQKLFFAYSIGKCSSSNSSSSNNGPDREENVFLKLPDVP
jgi:hypothetical protein